MYCHIHHCHYHHCHCVPKDSKEKGGALTQEELLALTEEMKDELKDYTVDLKDQIFSYIDIGVNPVEIANTFASLIEQDTYILRTLTNKIDELNNTTNLSVFKLRARVTDLEEQSATIIQELNDRTLVVESVDDLSTIIEPKDGLRAYVKSYHTGLGKGGGYFTYDTSKSDVFDEGVIINGWVREEVESITAHAFGVVGDGIVDDTEALRKFHEYCNKYNLTAYYTGLQRLAVQSDAKIYINTNVEFNNVPVTPLGNKFSNGGNWDISPHVMFIVEDELAPYEEIHVSEVPDYIDKNDYKFLAGKIDLPYPDSAATAVVSFNGVHVPNRLKTDTQPYKQAFRVLEDGRVILPLSQNISGADSFDITYRLDSRRGAITLNQPHLEIDSNAHRLMFIRVARSHVTVQNLTVNHMSYETQRSTNTYIDVLMASNFIMDGYTGIVVKGGTPQGYVFGAKGAVDVIVRNIHSAVDGGSVFFGTNLINGMTVHNCTLNRIDIHDQGHNVTVKDVTFMNGWGMSVGCGGGDIVLENIRCIDSYLWYPRIDYGGGYMNGTLTARNIRMISSKDTNIRLFDLNHNLMGGVWGADSTEYGGKNMLPIAFFNSIDIDKVSFEGPNVSSAEVLRLARRGGIPFNAPKIVRINNIDATGLHLNMWTIYAEMSNPDFSPLLDVSNVHAWRFTVSGKMNYAKYAIPNSRMHFTNIHIRDQFWLQWFTHGFEELRLENCKNVRLTSISPAGWGGMGLSRMPLRQVYINCTFMNTGEVNEYFTNYIGNKEDVKASESGTYLYNNIFYGDYLIPTGISVAVGNVFYDKTQSLAIAAYPAENPLTEESLLTGYARIHK